MVGRPPARNANTNAKPVAKTAAAEMLIPKRPREPFYVVLISGIVIGLIVLGLFISASAVTEKVRMSHGYGAVLDIVDRARRAALTDKQLGTVARQDLLMTLERLGQIQTAGETNGVKYLTNPWGGIVVALVTTDNSIRIETIVPTHVCQRFINFLFDQNPQALGLRGIEVKTYDAGWRQTYAESASAGRATDREIIASCGTGEQADVALLFALRQGN